MSLAQPLLIPGNLLTDKNLATIFKVSRSHVWEMLKNGDIPAPIKLSTRTTRWKADAIIEKLNQAA